MTAPFRYVLRNLGRRRLRTVAGVLGIFLTITLLMAIQIGLDSVSTSYTDLVALQAGKADILITAQGSHPFRPRGFDPDIVLAKVGTNKAVRGLAPRWIGVVTVRSPGNDQAALLVGVDPAAERDLDLWGIKPEPALNGARCAVSKALATRLGAGLSSRIAALADPAGSEIGLEIEAVVDRQLILPQEVREFVIVNGPTARRLLGEGRDVHALAGAFERPASLYDSRDLHASVLRLKDAGEAIAAAVGTEFDVRLPKATAISAFQTVASPLRAVFGVFAMLALAVTGLLVYSIVSVAVEERIREYGVLRTVGAKRSDILGLVLGETGVMCVLGVLPGVLTGAGAARLIVTLVELAMRAEVGSVQLAFSWSNIWLTLAAGAALSVGSALAPALQATRWRIVDALDPLRRGQIQVEVRREGGPNRGLFFAGIALSSLSVVVLFVLPTAFLSGNSSMIGTVMLCLLLTILLGFTLVAIGALPAIEGAVMRGIKCALGAAAELARRNLERHRRRNTTTALMFILSVALVTFVASLVVLFSRMSMMMVEHFNGADIRIESEDTEAQGLKGELAAIGGVQRVSEVRYLRSRSRGGTAYDVVLSDLVGMKHLWLVPFGMDGDLPKVLYTNHIGYAEGGPQAFLDLADYRKDGSVSTNPPPVVLSLAAARFLDVGQGDIAELSFHLGAERRTARVRIAAVCRTLPGFDNFRGRVANAIGSGMLMPMASFLDLTRGVTEETVLVRYYIKTRDGNASRDVARTLRDRFDLRFRFGVKAAVERKQEALAIYWTTQVFFGLLLALAVAISVFALIAGMATAVIERRWEIGMLKALGLRRSQLFRMFLSEALGVTLSAGLVGGAIGFGLAWLFVLEAGTLAEVPVVFTLPYVTFLATFAISIVAGAVAAHLPTRRLLEKPAAEILRSEA